MTAAAAAGHRRSDGSESTPSQSTPSIWQQLQQLLHEVPHLFSERIELLSLELERAGQALARIVILVVAAAVLLVTAWLAAWAVVFMLLVDTGVPPIPALLLVLLFNALVAGWALLRAKKLVCLLGLPATRRHLTVAAAKKPIETAPAPTSTAPRVHDPDHVAAGAR